MDTSKNIVKLKFLFTLSSSICLSFFPQYPSYSASKTFRIFLLLANINLLNPTGHVTHQQFNIQQLHVLPTLYLCVLYLSENKQRLVPLTA